MFELKQKTKIKTIKKSSKYVLKVWIILKYGQVSINGRNMQNKIDNSNSLDNKKKKNSALFSTFIWIWKIIIKHPLANLRV